MATGAELTYNTNASALLMANTIFGNGATVVSASYTGPSTSSAVYSNGQLAAGVTPSDTGVIFSTGDVRSFTQSGGDPNRSGSTSTNTSGVNNNTLFNQLAGANTYDAVWMDVDFIPTGNVMTMRFVFSSEEYPEYINTQYNDVFGVWINGSAVPIEVGSGRTSVNNINGNTTVNLYQNNTNDAFNTEMDGFTLTLTLTIPVNAGVVNSIRIGIADVADSSYDSNVLIAADSVQTVLVANADEVNLNPNGTKTLDVLANDVVSPGGTLTITHVNGVAVTAGSTITLASGQQITLNANGTFTLVGDGQVETQAFTYTIADGLGNTDTGLVTINSIPCFVAGTRIRTPQGDRRVEDLRPGDLVSTLDDGPQPVRWIGRRQVAAEGAFAPIRIRAGTFGRHGTLMLSPQHRVLVGDGRAELLFGEPEVLVAAKDLVDGRAVTVCDGGTVEYVHILFDRHQVVFSEGLATESFLPGPQTTRSFETEIVAEICAIFPELDPDTGAGYSPAARRALRAYEAQVLFAPARAA